MKNLFVALVAVMAMSSVAFAETIEFTCSNLDGSTTVVWKIGASADGSPLDSFAINGVEKKDFSVQYLFSVDPSSGALSNVLNLVEPTDAGRIHTGASIQVTQQGILLNTYSFNIDAAKPEDTFKQDTLACADPVVTGVEAPVAAPQAEVPAQEAE